MELAEERKTRKEGLEKERETAKKEKKQIEERIRSVKCRNGRKEREERKKNIIIKGMELKSEDSTKELTEYFRENLKISVETGKVRVIRAQEERNIIWAEMANWETKREIMTRKKDARAGIYIDNDLTEKGRDIETFERNKMERGKGQTVKIGYMKINIKDK